MELKAYTKSPVQSEVTPSILLHHAACTLLVPAAGAVPDI